MRIRYDKKIDAKYIKFNIRKKVARTEKQKAWLLVDRAQDGEVVGVEILNASRHPVSGFVHSEDEGAKVVLKERNSNSTLKKTENHIPKDDRADLLALEG
jgi:uncharacterized protein YuzE